VTRAACCAALLTLLLAAPGAGAAATATPEARLGTAVPRTEARLGTAVPRTEVGLGTAVPRTGVRLGTAVPRTQATTATTNPLNPLSAVPVAGDQLVAPPTQDAPPPGHRLSANQAGAIAEKLDDVRHELRRYPGSTREAFQKGTDRWQISYFAKVPVGAPRKEIAQIVVDDRSGAVLEHYTNYKVAWTMARGYPGAFGRIVNSPIVWIPLAVLFVAPFLAPWRRRRMLHLDLLVLSAFSISLACFNAARIDWSVPLLYPLLLYLLGRMLWVGLRSRADPGATARPLELLVPVTWLAVAVIFLLGFRVALNVTRSNVIDVGYAGVIGADRFADGRALYGEFPSDNQNGDTYGPVVYEAYMPFEQALPWSGKWDDLPAAHAASIAFDLLACFLLYLIGRRVRGPDLGVVLAYCWVTFPFTLYASMTNSNDALVAALVLAAVWAAARPFARGGLVALAGLTKFAPLPLAPLFAFHPRPTRRGVLWFAAGFALFAALAFVPVLAHNDLRRFWDASIAFQAKRGSPFSIWGLYEGAWIDTIQTGVQIVAVLGAIVVAFVPRRRDVVGLAALSAAILIALQLGVTHWFYLYVPWFFGLVMIALLGRLGPPVRVPLRA
jgi:Glycosyltransferase family 87